MSTRNEKLTEWHADPENMSLQNLDSWYLGGTVHTVPRKKDFGERGIESILEGWLPKEPLIRDDTRVIGVGSCFARYFILWLAENGFNKAVDTSPYNALMRYGATFESPAVIAQQFRWAFDEFSGKDIVWIGKDKEVFEANEERRQLVRDTLQKRTCCCSPGAVRDLVRQAHRRASVRALTRRHYDPERHVFRVETMQDTKRHLEKIEELRAKHLPKLKIVYTISPVRYDRHVPAGLGDHGELGVEGDPALGAGRVSCASTPRSSTATSSTSRATRSCTTTSATRSRKTTATSPTSWRATWCRPSRATTCAPEMLEQMRFAFLDGLDQARQLPRLRRRRSARRPRGRVPRPHHRPRDAGRARCSAPPTSA
jgi:hypothetical protein